MEQPLEKTPLYDAHVGRGARIVPFAGYEMPIQYSGVIAEHMAVRTAAGLFDVSHMGEIFLSGKDATPALQYLTTNDVSALKDGQIQYTALINPQGGFVDDVLLHRFDENHYFFCVNASNRQKDFDWIRAHLKGDVLAEDRSQQYAQIALQGPCSTAILQPVSESDLAAIRYYWFVQTKVFGREVLLARTGYTGEDGFEIYCAPEFAVAIWEELLHRGAAEGLVPVGLAARNTLRLEAKMALYGNDIDDTTTMWEADLGWIVKLKKGDFIGRDVLLKQKEEGIRRLLVGFEMKDRAAARDHYPIRFQGEDAGHVTSGSFAPFLKKNIGLVYLPKPAAHPGTMFEVVIRDQAYPAEVVAVPFYKRK